jgi:magnesium-transporting ATPase (P-type)
MQKEKGNIIDRLNEPQVIITILYILAITIGMIFNYAKYKTFGINIFDYSDITDFILFPFSDFKVLLFTLVIAILCLALYYIDLKLRDLFPSIFNPQKITKTQYKMISLVISIFLFMLFIFIVSKKYSQSFYHNISFADNITIHTQRNKYTGKYVGKTSDVIFIYQDNKLKIFPISSNIVYYQIN